MERLCGGCRLVEIIHEDNRGWAILHGDPSIENNQLDFGRSYLQSGIALYGAFSLLDRGAEQDWGSGVVKTGAGWEPGSVSDAGAVVKQDVPPRSLVNEDFTSL